MRKAGKDSPLQDLSLCQTMICYSHNRLKCISSKMVYLVQCHGLKRATVKNKKHSQKTYMNINIPERTCSGSSSNRLFISTGTMNVVVIYVPLEYYRHDKIHHVIMT